MRQEHRYSVLTRVGPGTPMGELMRQYWIPALMSDEVSADGDPVRLKLLGEELIAFRTTSGKVGVMDQRCPHRVASLFYGRNEEDGIRCVYHGWKFDVTGKCVDQGNIPVGQQFCERTPAKAYPTMERAGLVFCYMGHAGTLPELPPIRALLTDSDQLSIVAIQHECNWLQRLEGDIDTSHAGFLHAENRNRIETFDTNANPELIMFTNLQPEYKATETDYGTMYGAVRPADDKHDYWRIGHFLFPFFTMSGSPPLGQVVVNAAVPMDDHHTMRYSIGTKRLRDDRLQQAMAKVMGVNRAFEYLPATTDWYGRWRLTQNRTNDHKIDREMQRHGGSYSGIPGLNPQDAAIQESMGYIVDHSWENMSPSDLMIAKTRQRMLNVLDEMAKGATPPGVSDPEIYRGVSGGFANLPNDVDWLQAYGDFTKHQVRQPQRAAK